MAHEIPLRDFGKTGAKISALGLGGHHLGDAADVQTAERIVAEAVDGGITFFDNCWEYHRGKSEDWMGQGRPAQNLVVATNFRPFTPQEMAAVRERCRKYSAGGRFELYKTSTKYDGDTGREQHHYPSAEKLPA